MDFRVGLWLVRPGMNRIENGPRSVRLTPKSMELLVCLAKREGRVVSKDELFQEVWPATHVTDDALTKCIGELRRAFGESRQAPAIIETISKRGYRIVVPVTWGANDSMRNGEAPAPNEVVSAKQSVHPPPPWKRYLALAASGVLVLTTILLASAGGRLRSLLGIRTSPPAIRSIAVLPLTNLSSNPEQEYFADGMTDELITELAQIEAWKVISRTSVLQYRGTKKPIPEVARDLGVEAVVEGTVLRSGNRVRITAQLIQAATDTHLWSGSFEGELGDALALQRNIARGIAAGLRVKLGSHDQSRAGRNRAALPPAYEEYLKGRYFLNRNQFVKAASYFEQAAAKDPSFALAPALLYEADAMQAFRQDLPLPDRAIKALEAARMCDETLAEVRTDAGDIKFYWDWDWSAGEGEFRRAVELDPGSVDSIVHYAGCLHILARWDSALENYRRALELDPVSPRLHAQFVGCLLDAHRYQPAAEQLKKIKELDPNNEAAYQLEGQLFHLRGMENEAIAAYLQADALGGSTPEQVKELQQAAAMGGIRSYWKKRLEFLKRRAGQSRVPPLDFASLYVRAGDNDKAMEMLKTAYQQHAPRLVWIHARALWHPLRSDPRFQSLLRQMRFPDAPPK